MSNLTQRACNWTRTSRARREGFPTLHTEQAAPVRELVMTARTQLLQFVIQLRAACPRAFRSAGS
jgi:hypothetical protein